MAIDIIPTNLAKRQDFMKTWLSRTIEQANRHNNKGYRYFRIVRIPKKGAGA